MLTAIEIIKSNKYVLACRNDNQPATATIPLTIIYYMGAMASHRYATSTDIIRDGTVS